MSTPSPCPSIAAPIAARRRWLSTALLVVMAFLLAVGFAGTMRAQNAEDQGVLAGFISRLLSTPTSRVTIGAVEGAFSSNATIRNVAVADDAGVYLTIDSIRLVWRRAALLQRRIEIDRLEIGRITLARRPAAVSGEPEPGPILPELPLSVQVGALNLGELVLGEPVLGVAARLTATGSASLGRAAEGLRATLAIRRLDRAGRAELALNFVPEGERLNLALALDEPEGGLLARLAGIPGLPPVRLDLNGDGVLDDWRATLAFSGGPELDAEGTARLQRAGQQRTLSLGLDARIAPLLPPVAAPIFAGTTRLIGDVGFRDDGGVDVRALTLAAPLARAEVAGSIDPALNLDLTARASAVPNTNGAATVAGVGRLEQLSFEGSVKGPGRSPTVRGDLSLAGLSSPELALASLRATFALIPAPGAPAVLEFDASARGFVPADPALGAAIGRDITITSRASITDGVADVALGRVFTPVLTLDYVGRLGAELIDGRLALDSRRLQDFSALAGRRLGGAARLEAALTGARLSGDLARARIRAVLSGTTERLTLGDARLNALLGGSLQLDGALALADGSLAIDALRLRSPALDAILGGSVNAETVALEANAALANLRLLDERLAGRAEARLRLGGATRDPEVDLSLAAPSATALGQPIRDLAIDLQARTPLSAPQLALAGSGSVGGKPLRLEARLAGSGPEAARAWALDRLTASLGSVTIDGAGRIAASGLGEGRLAVAAGNLNDISPLVLRRLGGSLDAAITASIAPEGGQSLAIRAQGRSIAVDDVRIGGIDADLALADVWRAPQVRGQAAIADLRIAGERFETLALTAVDAGAGATNLTVSGKARGFDLSGAARLTPGPPVSLAIERFRAARTGGAGAGVIALAEPATLAFTEGGVRTGALRLAVAGGQVTLAGLIGNALDASIRASAVPLSAAAIFVPGLGLAGTLDAQATLTGTPAAPQGPFSLTVRNFTLPAARNAGVPALDIAASGRLNGDEAAVNGTIRSGQGIALTAAGTVPLSGAGVLDITLRGTLDAALANARLAGAGQRLAGRVAVDASVGGTLARPLPRGTATLTVGSFTDAAQGIRLTGVQGRVRAEGEALNIERLSASTSGGGGVTASGRVTLDPEAGFPGEVRLAARQAELIDSGLARLVANADLTLDGPLARAPRIAGRIGVITLDVRVPENFGGRTAPLTDARHIAPPAQTRARLALLARSGAGQRAGARPAPFNAALNVTVNAPGRIFVRGRGLDAELGGSVRLTGMTRNPEAIGDFELRRGRLTILTQRLDFSRGRLQFSGGLVPELDFVAEARAGDVTARVSVSGPANEPAFAFSSSPALPEDEVLSRLLFARAAGGLSPFQALQLAQAVAQLSGEGGGDPFESARRALGVDDLDITVGPEGPGIGISRALSDRARIGIRAGATPQSSGVGVDIDLTRRLRLQGELGADGRASAGIGIEQEY